MEEPACGSTGAASVDGGGTQQVESSASGPSNASNSVRQSATLCAKTPGVSMELAYATRPQRDRRPYDGRNPTSPLYAAGSRTEPPVSEPSAPSTLPQATATALPPLLPPCARKGAEAGRRARLFSGGVSPPLISCAAFDDATHDSVCGAADESRA